MSERQIDSEFDAACGPTETPPPKDWGDVSRYLGEESDRRFEETRLCHERLVNLNGLNLRDMLEGSIDEAGRLMVLSNQFGAYREEGMPLQDIRRLYLYAARGLIDPARVERAVDRALLQEKYPDVEARFEKAANPAHHRELLEEAVRRRGSLETLRLNIEELDALINDGAGIGLGEVLHIVGGEGGLKTSLLLHVLIDYVERGGRALFLSLDMHPQKIEERLYRRLLNCGQAQVVEHIRLNTPEYRMAKEARARQDDGLSIMGGPMNLTQIENVILASDADVVALDYVTAIDGFRDELTAARSVSKKFRELRDRCGLTFVLLSQMSRSSRQDQAKGGTGGHAIGGSALEQFTDYELELLSDAPEVPGGRPRLIATLRKNRGGPSGKSFEIFPFFPSLEFGNKAEPVERAATRKPMFSFADKIQWGSLTSGGAAGFAPEAGA